MKKSSLLIAALFAFTTTSVVTSTAFAQSRSRGHGTVHRTTTTTTHERSERHSRHSRRGHDPHRRVHRRTGVQIRYGWSTPYYRTYHHSYYYHPYYHQHTVIYDRRPEVIVEAEPQFEMPDLECPIRTDEVRSAMQQWCETSRGTKHGPFRRWYDNGVLAAEGEYAYDLKSGVWAEYHPNGAIREEGTYKDGARVGTWVTWGSDGEELVVVDY